MNNDNDALLKASDVEHIHHIAQTYAAHQYELLKKILTDLHLIKRKLNIID